MRVFNVNSPHLGGLFLRVGGGEVSPATYYHPNVFLQIHVLPNFYEKGQELVHVKIIVLKDKSHQHKYCRLVFCSWCFMHQEALPKHLSILWGKVHSR